jgi:hypothetical protein
MFENENAAATPRFLFLPRQIERLALIQVPWRGFTHRPRKTR